MLKILSSKNKAGLDRLIARRAQRLTKAEAVVRPILEAVRKRGDRALLQYAKKFDGLQAKSVRVPKADLARAAQGLNKDFRAAIDTASKQIRRFAELQMPRPWVRNAGSGVTLGQIVRPLGSVAAYIPGGRYPLPSTLMMTVIPAQVAEVTQISVASPQPSPQILGTAGRLEVENFFQMGGAQAIAAFAFGTETVPRADRIVGPGNIYVAAAKKLLAGEAGIDFIAGPTETVLISADGQPRVLAADILAQAEHDVEASAILLTTSRKLAEAVAAEVELQLKELPTRAVASKAITGNSAVVVTRSLNEAVDISNRLAPEHLTIHNKTLLPRVQNAGTVFIGPWSAEAAGDYAAGPNHVLPTSRGAALRGGLSVLDYVKIITVQQLEAEGLRRLAPAIVTLARAEGLEAHARSIEVRTNG
jgi:histidinol dehydrogenase